MEVIKKILFIIEIALFTIIALNFFCRVIAFFYKSHKLTYSEKTNHNFRCQSCGKEYHLNGIELKKLKKSSVLITKSTQRKTTKYFKTDCPLCGNKAAQEKIFDINIKFGGFVDIQMDEYSKPLIIDVLLKAALPSIVFLNLFGFLIMIFD